MRFVTRRPQPRPLHCASMSRRLLILWLMLALLPLRGWAAASMTVPSAAAEASVQMTQVADNSARAAPSCHGAPSDSSPSTGHACNLCDLCHGAAVHMADPIAVSSPLPDVNPRPVDSRDSGHQAVGGLDRPPRNILA